MIPEPTSDQCTSNESLTLADGRRAMACWYPQMGGYVGKALLVDDGGCVDVYVWHDGQFPFSGDDYDIGPRENPVELHHCDPSQFIRFGEVAARFADPAWRPTGA